MAITVAAGQRMTADVFNALVPKFIEKSGDESVTSSTLLQNDNDFASISFGANEIWDCEIFCEFQSASNTPDMQCDWAVTGTVVVDVRHILNLPVGEASVSGAANLALQARGQGDDVSSAVVIVSGSTRSSYRERIKVDGGASGGTLTFRWSQNTSDGNAATMKAGTSWFTAHRVS